MAKKGDPKVMRFVVLFLRHYAEMLQSEFGRAARIAQGTISDCEGGKVAPTEEQLRRMASVAGVPWTLVVLLRRFLTALLSCLGHRSASRHSAEEAPVEQAALDVMRLAMAPYWIEEETEPAADPSPDEERREAEAIWAALEPFPLAERRQWIELSVRAAGSWALAERISHASELAAADNADEALALAYLALSIAERVPGEARRARTVGYCLAFVANALRVKTEFDRADQEVARSWQLWQAGEAAAGSLPLAEWRLLDREASLCRAQHRFPEALARLDRALARCAEQPAAAGRLLLNKERILRLMGDVEGGLKILEQAAPLLEGTQESRVLSVLRFNTAESLCALGRHDEAEALLPALRELLIEPARRLDLARLHWLTSRIAAGQGRPEEAEAGLEQVIRDFVDLPYEAALASLDLAALYLSEGRTGDVKELALAMGPIFEAKGIAREALAALTLFCEAAKQESATVELVRQVIADVERAQ